MKICVLPPPPVLGIEPKALCVLAKCLATPQPWPLLLFLTVEDVAPLTFPPGILCEVMWPFWSLVEWVSVSPP